MGRYYERGIDMKIWIDDLRPMPEEFDKCFKSSYEAKDFLLRCALEDKKIELISLDHDAGHYAIDGGDYIKVLEYLEYLKKVCKTEVCTKFHIHTRNPVGAERMRQIIKSCNWEEI